MVKGICPTTLLMVSLTVIIAEPAPTAVTSPLPLTVATPVFVDAQE